MWTSPKEIKPNQITELEALASKRRQSLIIPGCFELDEMVYEIYTNIFLACDIGDIIVDVRYSECRYPVEARSYGSRAENRAFF